GLSGAQPQPNPAKRRRDQLRTGRGRGKEEGHMCLGIPGQIVEIVDDKNHIAKAEVSGGRRDVNIRLLIEGDDAGGGGGWVLIHVGFAMSKIDEEEARQTREFLEMLGEPYEQELTELKASAIE